MPIVRFGAICVKRFIVLQSGKFALRSGRFPSSLVRFTFFATIRDPETELFLQYGSPL